MGDTKKPNEICQLNPEMKRVNTLTIKKSFQIKCLQNTLKTAISAHFFAIIASHSGNTGKRYGLYGSLCCRLAHTDLKPLPLPGSGFHF
jgi:hypothetical protein